MCECVSLPSGLCVLEDYVSLEEESRLLQAVDWMSHSDDVTGEQAYDLLSCSYYYDNNNYYMNVVFLSAQRELKHRRVKHYGYEFRYDNNNVDKDKPLPHGQIQHHR